MSNSKIYLDLNKKAFKETEKEAIASAKANDPNNEECQNGLKLLYENMTLRDENIEYEDGEIHLSGQLQQDEKDLGFIDISFRPDADLVASIIETYVKQLNKVKTILEATK